MKHTETHYGGNWLDKLLNSFPFLLDDTWIKPVAEFAWGGNPNAFDRPLWSRVVLRFFGGCTTDSMYHNNVVYIRALFPLAVFCMIRWSGSTTNRAFIQFGMGWKLNGRFAITFRIQSDASAAAGYWGPNYGQAPGWHEGPH